MLFVLVCICLALLMKDVKWQGVNVFSKCLMFEETYEPRWEAELGNVTVCFHWQMLTYCQNADFSQRGRMRTCLDKLL